MSSYDYYNRKKKAKLFSWKHFAKLVGIILACFIGAFGLLILGLYLAGSFDPDKIPPDGIKFKIEEEENSKIQVINGVNYYIPDLTQDESGEYVFSLMVEDALKSVSEEDANKPTQKANLLDLTVSIDDERVVKFSGDKAELNSPIEFTAVKGADSYITGGFATIKVRSGDGVYGETSINVFLDVPVAEVSNNFVPPYKITRQEKDRLVNVLCVGDKLAIAKPNYLPARSSNPSVLANGQALLADKYYSYKVEFETLNPDGSITWHDIDATGTNEDNKIVKWINSNNEKALTMVKTGLFRLSCATYATYDDQKVYGTLDKVESEYTYFRVENVSYAGINLSIKEHTFTYAMQYAVPGQSEYKKVESKQDAQIFRVYLNTRKDQIELERLNAINLGINLSLPEGYQQSQATILSALKNVYLTYNEETMEDCYEIIYDNSRSTSTALYPLSIVERYPIDGKNNFESVEEFYFEFKLIERNPNDVEFKFNIRSAGESSPILTDIVKFSMKENSSVVSFKDAQNSQSYGKYLSISIADAVVSNKEVKLMNLRIDTTEEGDNAHYVDLNKLTQNIPLTSGEIPSYWKIKHYLGLGESQEIATTNLISMADKISNINGDITKIDSNLYGAEIIGSKFMPKAYARYELYAVLIQTDINGQDVLNITNQTYSYSTSKVLIADVQVQLSSVKVSLYDKDGGDCTDDETLDEGATYFLQIEPSIQTDLENDDILANYVDSLSVIASDTVGSNKEIPISIGEVKYYNAGSLVGYYAQIEVLATSDQKARNIRFFVKYSYLEDGTQKEQEFGHSNEYMLRDTAVRSVTFTNAKEMTFKAQWNNSKVEWYYEIEGGQKTILSNSEFELQISVVGDNKSLSVSSNNASITTKKKGNSYYLVIGSIVDTNQIITITAESIENPNIKDAMQITLETPTIVFGINNNNLPGISVDRSTNEVKKVGESGVYNHIVYNGDIVDLKGEVFNNGYEDGIITAMIGNTHVEDMLQFSFEMPSKVESFASIDGSKVSFNFNPAETQIITVLVQGFSSTLKFIFRLENNIIVDYARNNDISSSSRIPDFFNSSINTTAQSSTQNRVVMSYYNNAYYPTIVYSSAQNKGTKVAFLDSLITIKSINGAEVPAMNFVSYDLGEYLIISPNGENLTLQSGKALSSPLSGTIRISAQDGSGKVVEIPLLLVPDFQVQTQTTMTAKNLRVNDQYLIVESEDVTNIVLPSGKVIFLPENYIFLNNPNEEIKEYSPSVDSLGNPIGADNKLIKLNAQDSVDSLFALRDFAGNMLSSASSAVLSTHGINDIVFSFNSINASTSTSYHGLSITQTTLSFVVETILTKKNAIVYMLMHFNNQTTLETRAVIAVNPYYEITLDETNAEVQKAISRAELQIFEKAMEGSIYAELPRMVLYKQQNLTLYEALTVANDSNKEYLGKFSYSWQYNPNNILDFQNSAEATLVQVKAKNFSGKEFGILKIEYEGVDTGFRCVIFITEDANVFASDKDNGLNENAVLDGAVQPGTVTDKPKENLEAITKVQSTTEFNLNNMFSLPTLSDDGNSDVTLLFTVTNLEAVDFVRIANDGLIMFSETANDTLVEITINSSKQYLDNELKTQNLIWKRYFVLEAAQKIEINYPYVNKNIFADYYEDENLNKVGVGNYIRLKGLDELNLGNENGLVNATRKATNENIWNDLIFEVEEYDAVNVVWKKSNIYAITDKSITIPNNIAVNTYTRVHITSEGGIDAYVNILLSTNDDAMPTLSLEYPTSTTHRYIGDSKYYEFRDKSKLSNEGSDIIPLVVHDNTNNLNVKRIALSTENQTLSRLYYDVQITQMGELDDFDAKVNAYVNADSQLVVTGLANYLTSTDFVVRVFVRTDYGYYYENGQIRSYNFFYGDNITIQLGEGLEDGEVNKTIIIGQNNTILNMNDLFRVIAVDGAVPEIKASHYSINNQNTNYLVENNGKWYLSTNETYEQENDTETNYDGISSTFNYGGVIANVQGSGNIKSFTITYTNYSVTSQVISGQANYILDLNSQNDLENIPSCGILLTITLKLQDGIEEDCVIRIFPSVATLSNNGQNGTGLNLKENCALLACGETLVVSQSQISYTNLTGALTFSAESNEFNINVNGTNFEFTLKNSILEPNAKPYVIYFNIKNSSGVVVRHIPYYVSVFPNYQIEVGEGNGIETTGEYSFAKIYSGSVYDLTLSANPYHFILNQTLSQNSYSPITDYSEINFAFKLYSNGIWQDLILNENQIMSNSGRVYALLNGTQIESRISADDYIIKVIARVNSQTSEVIGYSCKEFIIRFVSNVLIENVQVTNPSNTLNTALDPLVMTADGINLLDYLNVDLLNANSLSSIYGNPFDLAQLLKLCSYSSTTFNNENVIILDILNGKMTKNSSYFTSETTVHSITLYLYGIKLIDVFVSIPRDYAYTFDSAFSNLYSSDSLDLNLLSNSFVGQSGNELRNGEITYQVISITAGSVSDINISDNNTLTVTENKNLSRKVTLLAKFNQGEITQTAKAVISIEPEYSLTTTQNVYYSKTSLDSSDAILTYGGVRQNVEFGENANNQLKKIEISGMDASLSNLKANKITYNNLETITFLINNKCNNHKGQKTANVIYSPKTQTENLVAGLDVELSHFLGEFAYAYEEQNAESGEIQTKTKPISSVTNIKYFEVLKEDADSLEYKECTDNLLKSKPSAIEQDVIILVQADLDFALGEDVYSGSCFGMFTIKLYPTIMLNASYTHNAQGVSVFKALQSYDLSASIIPTSTKDEFKQNVKEGIQNFDIMLYDRQGNEITENVSSYYSIYKEVKIGGELFYIIPNQSEWYLSANTTFESGVDIDLTPYAYGGENSLTYENLSYDVIHKIIFQENAVGCTAVVNGTYVNDYFQNVDSLIVNYFIKVDAMELDLTSLNPTLKENDVISYASLVKENSENKKADNANSITFQAVGDYFEIEQNAGEKTARIINTSNIYDVQAIILITFSFGGKEFIYSAEFTLESTIQIENIILQNGESQTQYEFTATERQISLLSKVTYANISDKYKNYGLLTSINVTANNQTYEFPTKIETESNNEKLAGFKDGTNTEMNDYSLSFKSGDIGGIFFEPKESISAGTTFEIAFVFKSVNQRKHIQIKLVKVESSQSLSATQLHYTQFAGDTIDLKQNTFSLNGVNVSDEITFDVSDSSLLKISDEEDEEVLSIRPIVTDTEQEIMAYIFASYIDEQAQQFHSIRLSVTIKTRTTASITADNGGYLSTSLDNIKSYTETYKLIEYTPNQTNEEIGTGKSGTKLERYFSTDGNKFTPKTTYSNAVELYLYTTYQFNDFNVLNVGQKFVLSKRIAINPTTPTLKVGEDAVENNNGIYVYDKDLGDGKLVSVDGATGITLKYYDTSNQTVAFEVSTIKKKDAQENVYCPILVTATSQGGDVYQFILYVIVKNPDYSVNQINVNGTLNAGKTFLSGYNSWYKVTDNAVTIENGSTVAKDAKYYLGFKLNGTVGSVEVFNIMHEASITLIKEQDGTLDIGENNTLEIYNNFTNSYAIKFEIDGENKTANAEISVDFTQNIVTVSNNVITFVAGNWSGNQTFTVNVKYNNITYSKQYTVNYTNAYFVNDLGIITHNFAYDNGVVYSGDYAILNSDFTYTNSAGVKFKVTGISSNPTITINEKNKSDLLNVSCADNVIKTNAYPEFYWTKDGNGNITGLKYHAVNIEVAATFTAQDGSNKTISETLNFEITRSGIGGYSTTYKEGIGAPDLAIQGMGTCKPLVREYNVTGIFPWIWVYLFQDALLGFDKYIVIQIDEFGGSDYGQVGNDIGDIEDEIYLEISNIALNGEDISETGNTYSNDLISISYSKINTFDLGSGEYAVTVGRVDSKFETMNFDKINEWKYNKKFNGFITINSKLGDKSTYSLTVPIQANSGNTSASTGFTKSNVTEEIGNSAKNQTSFKSITLMKDKNNTQSDIEYIKSKLTDLKNVQITGSNGNYSATYDGTVYSIVVENITVSEDISSSSNSIKLVGDDDLENFGNKFKLQNIMLYYDLQNKKFFAEANNETTSINYESISNSQAQVGDEIKATNSISYSKDINAFSSDQESNKNITTTISEYFTIKGVVTAYPSEKVLVTRDRNCEAVEFGVRFTNDNVPVISTNESIGEISFSGASDNTQYSVQANGGTIILIQLSASPISLEYQEPPTRIQIESYGYFIINSTNIGTLTLIKNGSEREALITQGGEEAENTTLIINTLSDIIQIDSSNPNRINAGFVLENTLATIQIELYRGSNGPYVFNFDVEIISNIEIELPSILDCEVGTNLNLNTLYSVKENGIEIDFAQINGEVTFYVKEDDREISLENGYLPAEIINANAGKLIQVNAEFTTGATTITRTIGISVSEELFELNVIEDVFSLYSGQSIDLKNIHLKLQNPDGYSLGGITEIEINSYGEYLIIEENSTIIKAMNVFDDVATSVTLQVICQDKTYLCAIDIYILETFITKNEVYLSDIYVNQKYSILNNESHLSSLILNNIKVSNYLGENIVDLETYFDFGFQGSKDNDFKFDYSVFKPHSEENLVVELNVYHKGSDKIVKTINLHITELLADRELTFRQGYDQNSVVTVSNTQYGLSNLFNSDGILEYSFLTNNISNIDASWYTFKLAENYEGITLNGNIITNNNTAPFANMFDQVEIIVTDNNTEETLRFQIKIARNLSE